MRMWYADYSFGILVLNSTSRRGLWFLVLNSHTFGSCCRGVFCNDNVTFVIIYMSVYVLGSRPVVVLLDGYSVLSGMWCGLDVGLILMCGRSVCLYVTVLTVLGYDYNF
jgi:hypothetical protein